MQLYLLVRGHADRMDRLKNDLLAQYLPYEYEPGKKGLLQLSVRKVELWELAFPEECLNEVLGMVSPLDNRLGRLVNFFRKILGLGGIDRDVKKNYRVIFEDISVIPVGVKRDKFATLKRQNKDFKRELI